MISFFKRKINICQSLLWTYKNLSAKFKQYILTFPFEIIVWPQKTAKMLSFGNIWSVFHLTTHEKRKTDQNYKKKHTKHCITRHFFLEWLLYCKKISPDQSKTFLICWPPISMAFCFNLKYFLGPKGDFILQVWQRYDEQ